VASDQLVTLALLARRDKLLIPHVNLSEVREPALGKRPKEVERGSALVIRAQQAPGIRLAPRSIERVVVDGMPPEDGEPKPTQLLALRRPWLGELPRNASDLDDRDAGRIGKHGRHLQDDLQLVPDGVGRELRERLGAIAGLQEEGLSPTHPCKGSLEAASLPGEDERWELAQFVHHRVQPAGVGPLRLLRRDVRPPRGGRPGRHGSIVP
jgi:hypothetical protein